MQKFLVPVLNFGLTNKALLRSTNSADVPQPEWIFNWEHIYKTSKSEKRILATLEFENKVMGLISFAIAGSPSLITIENLEVNPLTQGNTRQGRLAEPIGKWLIWYCIKIGLLICTRENPFVILFASSSSKLYYQRAIGMTYKNSIFLNNGEVHVFTFDRQAANAFCNNQEKKYGQTEPVEE
jgi:hypothetical protein